MPGQARPTLSQLWPSLAPLMIPWDGTCSQIWVFDLPRADIARGLDLFQAQVGRVRVSTAFDHSFASDAQPVFDTALRARLIEGNGAATCHVLLGNFGKDRQVQLWLHDRPGVAKFDGELVFWADQFFPPDHTDTQNQQCFEPIFALTEALRADHPACGAALSAGAGDPREMRDTEWVLFW